MFTIKCDSELIYNIFTNNLASCVSGIILNDLSDHLPVFAYFDDATLTRSTERKIVMRTFNDDNLHKFNENLSNAKWSLFRHMEDPNEAYNDFIEGYSRIYNTCFPLKVLKGKQVNKFFSPWLSRGLLKSVRRRTRRTDSTKSSSLHLPHLLRRSIKPTKTNSPILFALPNVNTTTGQI